MNKIEPWKLNHDAPDMRNQKRWRVSRNEEGDDTINGRYGSITKYPDSDLDIWVTSKTQHIVIKIEKLGWKAKNHYDDGALFIRPFRDFDLAASLLKCRKRRQISEKQRLESAERLRSWRDSRKKT